MSPPDLPRQSPIAYLIQPLDGIVAEAVGRVLDILLHEHGPHLGRDLLHVHKPLLHRQGFDDCATLIVVRYGVFVIFYFFHQPLGFQRGHDGLASRVAIQPRKASGSLGHNPVKADDLNLR